MTTYADLDVIRAGETYRLRVKFEDAAGAAIDLTGATFEGRLALPGGVETIAATVDAAGGEVLISVDRTATANWPAGRLSMEVWADYGEGAAIEAARKYTHEFICEA